MACVFRDGVVLVRAVCVEVWYEVVYVIMCVCLPFAIPYTYCTHMYFCMSNHTLFLSTLPHSLFLTREHAHTHTHTHTHYQILPPFTFEHRGLFPDKEKYHMLRRFESERLRIWWSSSREQGISPSFNSFLKFLTMIHGK